jgi:hypothetical protein
VDVGGIPAAERLITELAVLGVRAEAVDGAAEMAVDGEGDLDLLRDVIARLELPLYRLGSRLTSLDDVFMQRAGRG